jgi:hypothetical protein
MDNRVYYGQYTFRTDNVSSRLKTVKFSAIINELCRPVVKFEIHKKLLLLQLSEILRFPIVIIHDAFKSWHSILHLVPTPGKVIVRY